MRSLTLGQTRLLFSLMAEEHEESERAVREADERLVKAREAWEHPTEDQKTRLAE